MLKEGEIVKKLLKGLPKTQEEIAQELGMTRQNLSHHFRKDKLQPDFERLIKEKLNVKRNENGFYIDAQTKSASVVDAEYLELVREQMKNLKNQFSILEELLRRTDK